MIKEKRDTTFLEKLWFKFLFVLLFILSLDLNGQSLPSDDFYNNNIGMQEFDSELPSNKYYKKHLRSDEWEDDGGPGGSEDGSNQGVGVPLTGGVTSMITCILIYSVLIFFKRKRQVFK